MEKSGSPQVYRSSRYLKFFLRIIVDFNIKSATFASLWISQVNLKSQHFAITIRINVQVKKILSMDIVMVYQKIALFVLSFKYTWCPNKSTYTFQLIRGRHSFS